MDKKLITVATVVTLILPIEALSASPGGNTRSAAMTVSVTVVRNKVTTQAAAKKPIDVPPAVAFSLIQQAKSTSVKSNYLSSTGSINSIQKIFFSQANNNVSPFQQGPTVINKQEFPSADSANLVSDKIITNEVVEEDQSEIEEDGSQEYKE